MKKLDIALLITSIAISVICYFALKDVILNEFLSEFIPPTQRLITVFVALLVSGLAVEIAKGRIYQDIHHQESAVIAFIMLVLSVCVFFIEILFFYVEPLVPGIWYYVFIVIYLFLILYSDDCRTDALLYGMLLLLLATVFRSNLAQVLVVILNSVWIFWSNRYPETVNFE